MQKETKPQEAQKAHVPFVLLVVSSLFLDTVRISVLHLEPMQDLPVRTRQRVSLPFPLVELTEHHGIAVECGQAAAVFEDRLREEVGVKTTGSREIVTLNTSQFLEECTSSPVSVQRLIERSELEDFLGIFQASMCDITHEIENNSNISVIDVRLALHSFPDQPQNFQPAVNDLVFSRACCRRNHAKPSFA
jgi:hypothetical protein